MEFQSFRFNPGFSCNSTDTGNEVAFYLMLSIAFLFSTFTLVFILANKQLRQQRFIFQFNIILADLISIIAHILTTAIKWHPVIIAYFRGALVIPLIVSVINILFVAIYQLITIRIDPFGVRNIITTPRCVVACIASWIICGVVIPMVDFMDVHESRTGTNTELAMVILLTLVFILTGVCLGLIYGVVARAPCENVQMEERKEGNKRVLRTFALVYATSLISAAMMCTLSIKLHVSQVKFVNAHSDSCLIFLVMLVTSFNWMANSVVYLWRLKEFRSIVFSCRGTSRVEAAN